MSNHTDILHHLRIWRFRIAFVIGCLLISCVSAFAGIALELKAPKSVYLLDEPIYATVTLHNTSQSDVKVFRLLELGFNMLSVLIMSPDGETYRLNARLQYGMMPGGMVGSMIRLYPDKSFGSMLEIMNWSVTRYDPATFEEYGVDPALKVKPSLGHPIKSSPRKSDLNAKGMMRKTVEQHVQTAFEKPGKYIIRCRYTTNGELGLDPSPIYSNKLIVRIDAPKGDDLLVYNRLLQDSEELPFGVWDIGYERIHLYEELLVKYPKSVYAAHIRYRLAEALEMDAILRLRGKETAYPTLKKAAELFSQSADESVGSPMSPYLMRTAGRTFAKIGDNERAMTLMIAAFTSKDSTEQDRSEVLSWIHFIENGMLHMESGIVKYASDYTVWVPFESFASSMGYTVRAPGGPVNLFYANLVAALDASKGTLTIDDGKPVNVRVRVDAGRVLVAPKVIGRLMAAKYGKEGSTSFKYLIDGPKLP